MAPVRRKGAFFSPVNFTQFILIQVSRCCGCKYDLVFFGGPLLYGTISTIWSNSEVVPLEVGCVIVTRQGNAWSLG